MTALINHGARRIIYLDYVETNLAFVRVIFKKNETIKHRGKEERAHCNGLEASGQKVLWVFTLTLLIYLFFSLIVLKFRTSDGRYPTPEHFVARGSEIVSYVAVSVPNEKE